jgi:DNA-binding transcriptional LysR family regulator
MGPTVQRDRIASLTLQQLRIFVAVAREGAFSRAASALFISGASVSEQIRGLETIVGARLFERSPGRRDVVLTDPGRLLLPICSDFFRALETGLGEIQSLHVPEVTVTLGASPLFGGYIFPRLYESFRRRHPGISVRVEVGPRREMVDALRRGTSDLAAMTAPPGPIEGLDDGSLLVETFGPGTDVVLIGPPGHRLAGPEAASIRELAAEAIVMPEGPSPMRDTLIRLAAAEGVNLRTAWGVRNLETQIQAVSSGIGITPTMMEVVASRISAGQVVLLNVEGFPYRFELTMLRRHEPLTPAAQAVYDHLMQPESGHESA